MVYLEEMPKFEIGLNLDDIYQRTCGFCWLIVKSVCGMLSKANVFHLIFKNFKCWFHLYKSGTAYLRNVCHLRVLQPLPVLSTPVLFLRPLSLSLPPVLRATSLCCFEPIPPLPCAHSPRVGLEKLCQRRIT